MRGDAAQLGGETGLFPNWPLPSPSGGPSEDHSAPAPGLGTLASQGRCRPLAVASLHRQHPRAGLEGMPILLSAFEMSTSTCMSGNRGGQLFAGSLGVAGIGAFNLPTPYRWAAIAWLAFVGSVLAVANWSYLAIFARRGNAPSMFPLLGNLTLLLAGFAFPLQSFRGWAIVGRAARFRGLDNVRPPSPVLARAPNLG